MRPLSTSTMGGLIIGTSLYYEMISLYSDNCSVILQVRDKYGMAREITRGDTARNLPALCQSFQWRGSYNSIMYQFLACLCRRKSRAIVITRLSSCKNFNVAHYSKIT